MASLSVTFVMFWRIIKVIKMKLWLINVLNLYCSNTNSYLAVILAPLLRIVIYIFVEWKHFCCLQFGRCSEIFACPLCNRTWLCAGRQCTAARKILKCKICWSLHRSNFMKICLDLVELHTDWLTGVRTGR